MRVLLIVLLSQAPVKIGHCRWKSLSLALVFHALVKVYNAFFCQQVYPEQVRVVSVRLPVDDVTYTENAFLATTTSVELCGGTCVALLFISEFFYV